MDPHPLTKKHPNTPEGEAAAKSEAKRAFVLPQYEGKVDPDDFDVLWNDTEGRWFLHFKDLAPGAPGAINIQQEQVRDEFSGDMYTGFFQIGADGKPKLVGFRASEKNIQGLDPTQLLEIRAQNVVGNQIVYELMDGTKIRQNIEKPDKVISGADIKELRTTMLNDGSSLQWYAVGDQVKNFHIPADVDLSKVKFSHAERLGKQGEPGYNELVAVMTDGSKFRFSADTEVMDPKDIEIAHEVELDDRTVVILNDGTKVQIPNDEDLPTAEILQDEQTNEWYVKQPDGRLTFFEPYREGKLTTLPNGEIAVIQPDGRLAPWPTKYQSGTFRDPNTGRWFEQQTTGAIREMDPRTQPGVVQMGGREFLQQGDTSLEELDPRFQPGVISRDGVQLIQQLSGQVSQTRAANLDEVIAQALIDGNFDKAFAFQDFKTRPTALEAFQAAVAFARAPADQQLISSLARGETTVEPPPPGTIRRVGPQPDFLVQEYNTFQQRLRAGRPPSAAEQQQFMTRFQEGRTPLTDQHEATISQQQQQLEQQKANFDLRMAKLETANQKQQQDYNLKIAQANKDRVTGQRTVDAAYAAAGGDPTGDSGDVPTYQETVDGVTRTYRGTKGTPGANPTAALYVDPATGQRIDNMVDFASSLGAFDMLVTTNPDGSTSGASALSIDHIVNIARQAANSGQNVGTAIRNAINKKRNDVIANAPADSMVSQGSFSSKVADAPAAAPAPAPVSGITPDTISTSSQGMSNVAYQEAYEEAEEAAAEMERPVTSGVDIGRTETGFDVSDVDLGSWQDIDAALSEQGFETHSYAQGGMTHGKNLEIVGEEGPELVDLPPGTFVLPIKGLNQRQVRQAKRRGVPGYQSGGVVFEGLPFGLRQLQAGRAITPPRGYLSRAAGLTLPSAQAFQNITPESRDVFMDLASQAGIPPKSFAQELQLTQPRGARQPTVRMLPFSSRGAR